MENTSDKKYEPKNIKSGEYKFYIKGVLTKDSNGYELRTKNGNLYKKLKIVIVEGEDTHTIDKFIFSRQDIKEIVLAISNPALTHVYNFQGDDFEIENLVGESGFLLMGRRFNEKDGKNYPQIECFLKPKLNHNEVMVKDIRTSSLYPTKFLGEILTPTETPIDEDVPF